MCGLDLLQTRHVLLPLLEIRILIKRQAAKRMRANPRFEVKISAGDASRQDTLTARLCQLSLDNTIAAIRLFGVSLDGIVVLLCVVMPARKLVEHSPCPLSPPIVARMARLT